MLLDFVDQEVRSWMVCLCPVMLRPQLEGSEAGTGSICRLYSFTRLVVDWRPRFLSVCLSARTGLRFLTAWWMDSKGKFPKKDTHKKLDCLSWPSIRSHAVPLLSCSVHQSSHKVLPRCKGRESRLCLLVGNVKIWKSKRDDTLPLPFLENTIFHRFYTLTHKPL